MENTKCCTERKGPVLLGLSLVSVIHCQDKTEDKKRHAVQIIIAQESIKDSSHIKCSNNHITLSTQNHKSNLLL